MTGSLDVYQLNAERDPDHPFEGNVPSSPTEGRLVKIANGYGAVTTIGYRSAKEDFITDAHQVPFPEIVVTAVGTTDEFGSSLEAPTLYAYGHAELHFDPRYDAFIFPGYRLLGGTAHHQQPGHPPADGRRRNHHRHLPARAIRREHGCECPLQALPQSRTCQRRHDDQRKRRQGSLGIAGHERQHRPASYRQYALRLGHAHSPYGSYW